MISAFTNSFKIPELRARILFTLALLVVFRIGVSITCPGVNAAVIQAWFDSQVNNQSGGSVAALFKFFCEFTTDKNFWLTEDIFYLRH